MLGPHAAHRIFSLCCGMWDLYLRHADSQLQRVRSRSLTRDLTWAPLRWGHRVLAPGPSEKSPILTSDKL